MQGKHRSIDEYWAGVILTAGAGRRMAPLNLCRPKALMPVCNVPLLAYQYRTMAALDVGRLIVQTGDLDGLAIKSAHQSALSRVEGYEPSIRWLTDMDEGDFSMRLLCDIVDTNLVVLNCDRVGTYPLSAAKSAHSASEATCTWALTPHLQGVESASWQIGESGRLARYSRSRLPLSYNNTGIVLAGPQFVRQMADPSSGHPFDFTGQQPWFGYPPQSNVFWDAAPELKFRSNTNWFGFVAEDSYIVDAGTPSGYFRAHFDFLTGVKPLLDYKRGYTENMTCCWVHPSASLASNVILTPPVLIGPYAHIQSGASIGPFAVIGDRSVIADKAHIAYSVLWEDVYVEKDVSIAGCIIGDGVLVATSVERLLVGRDPRHGNTLQKEHLAQIRDLIN